MLQNMKIGCDVTYMKIGCDVTKYENRLWCYKIQKQQEQQHQNYNEFITKTFLQLLWQGQ